MPPLKSPGRPLTVRRWLASTSRRTFVLYPVCIVFLELLLKGGTLAFEPIGVPLLIWGYGQYRWSGSFRTRHGGGGPGIDVAPARVVDTGIYAYVRNPMYLGHLIFMAGLAVTFRSAPALALLIFHLWWFHQRVLEDEKHLTRLFGDSFADYTHQVRRWGVV